MNTKEIKLIPLSLKSKTWCVDAFAFIPMAKRINVVSIFTHGYTSGKFSIMSWGQKMAEEGVASIVFDLPGHFLGSIHNELDSFDDFKEKGHFLFTRAYEELVKLIGIEALDQEHKKVIGGHSLGGLMALRALSLDKAWGIETLGIGVGLGKGALDDKHLLQTPFFKNTLDYRAQLVAKALNPETVFSWISEEKEKLQLSGHEVFLLSGEDDAVIGRTGAERLGEELRSGGCKVTVQRPRRLPHNNPELAATYLKQFYKEKKLI